MGMGEDSLVVLESRVGQGCLPSAAYTLCRSKALGGPVYAPCWLSPDWHFMGGRHTLPDDSGLEKGAGSQYSQGVKAARSTSRVQVAHS